MSLREAVDVVVVGAGLAGLAAAGDLARSGLHVALLEAAPRPGGRMATDRVEGFLLDRGFQVLNDAYPALCARVDLAALGCRAFEPGARVRWQGGMHAVSDPLRHPRGLVSSLRAPFVAFSDMLPLLAMRRQLNRVAADPVQDTPQTTAPHFKAPQTTAPHFKAPQTTAPHSKAPQTTAPHFKAPQTTAQWLAQLGFSRDLVQALFRPLLAGILLDPALEASSRRAAFALGWFAKGAAILPAEGMGAVPAALAAALPAGVLQLSCPVESVQPGKVVLRDGRAIMARAVVVATDAQTAAEWVPGLPVVRWRGVIHMAFDAPRSPVRGGWLVLDGDGAGPVNDLCVPSEVQPGYAPPGRALVSATVLDSRGAKGSELEAAVRAQLRTWFGGEVDTWRTLRALAIERALVEQLPGNCPVGEPALRASKGLYLAGDYLGLVSSQTALASGAAVSQLVRSDLEAPTPNA